MNARDKAVFVARLQKASAELAEAFRMATANPDPVVIAAILKAKRMTADAVLAVTGGHKITLGELLSSGSASDPVFPRE